MVFWSTRRCSAFDAVRFVGPHGDLDAISGAELGHQAGEVSLDGAEADVELVGDLTVRSTAGHREQDFFFTARERLGGLSRWSSVAGVGERGEQSRGDARGDQCIALGGGVDRLDEKWGSGVL